MTVSKEASRELAKQQFLKALNNYHVGKVDLSTISKVQTWAMQGDGIYLLHKNKIGIFIHRKMDVAFPGLETQFNCKDSYCLFVPKIDKKFYDYTLNFFRDVNEKFSVSEAFIQFYYDLQAKKYVAHVPNQKVGAARVKYDAAQNLDNVDPKRYVLVFEVHSHGNMSAFFSGTDNADEKDTRFYGVIGDFNKSEQSEKYRYIINKEEAVVSKEVIFDFSQPEQIPISKLEKLLKDKKQLPVNELEKFIRDQKDTEYPKEWMTKIQKEVCETTGHVSEFHSRINEAGIEYHKKRAKFKTEDEEEIDMMFGDDKPAKLKNQKFIGSIPVNLYAESMEVIYDMGEFAQDEVEHILELIACSISPDEAEMMLDKMIDHGLVPERKLWEMASYQRM